LRRDRAELGGLKLCRGLKVAQFTAPAAVFSEMRRALQWSAVRLEGGAYSRRRLGMRVLVWLVRNEGPERRAGGIALEMLERLPPRFLWRQGMGEKDRPADGMGVFQGATLRPVHLVMCGGRKQLWAGRARSLCSIDGGRHLHRSGRAGGHGSDVQLPETEGGWPRRRRFALRPNKKFAKTPLAGGAGWEKTREASLGTCGILAPSPTSGRAFGGV